MDMQLVRRGIYTPTPEFDGSYYNAGQEFVEVTGGFSNTISIGDGQAIKYMDYLHADAYASTVAREFWVSENLIDLSTVNKLKVLWEATTLETSAFAVLIVSDDLTFNTWDGRHLSGTPAFTLKISELDVSSLTGSYYIAAGAQDGLNTGVSRATVNIYRIWGE